MAERLNGHVMVSVGVSAPTPGSVGTAPTGRRMTAAERREKAQRLRREGWSYRRISATLGLSYGEVSRLLDGDDGRIGIPYNPLPLPTPTLRPVSGPPQIPKPAAPVSAPVPAPAPMPTVAPRTTGATALALEELATQNRCIQQKVEYLMRQGESHRQALIRIEKNLVDTLQNEHRQLGQRLQSALGALLERLLPAALRPAPPPPPKPPRNDDAPS